jgi:malate dehydrogenase (oxaloacetate-decarboxylating)(NADP+)
VSHILAASLHVAARIAEHIFDAGLAQVDRPPDIAAFIQAQAYKPEYATAEAAVP